MAETLAPELEEEDLDVVEEAPHEEERSIARDRPRRVIRPPQGYCDFVAYALSVGEETNSIGEPTSYSEAISSVDSSKWLIFIQEEIESLYKNETWVLVKPPTR